MGETNSRVVLSSCIEWDKYISPQGYGKRWHKGKLQQAHRVALCEHLGIGIEEIQDQVVRHMCDNTWCVNPEHLELGSQADNIRDMDERGRRVALRGTDSPVAKLSQQQVDEIRERYVPYCRINGARALSREYGVDHKGILNVVKHITYK